MTEIGTTDFRWLNPPSIVSDSPLCIETSPATDFWQNTHYGFQRDNGHFYFTEVDYNFQISVKTTFKSLNQYDQCGLMVRIDSGNWIKASVEYEDESYSRLGSVVTNNFFSDWATTDISGTIQNMWYRISSKDNDFLIQNSIDGYTWKQLRIAHIAASFQTIQIGVYACSPMEGSFQACFDHLKIEKSSWDLPA